MLKNYLNYELEKLKRYFDDNIDFNKYYRTGNNYLCHKYFTEENFILN
nr:RteC domain-containing protein [Flavobacterium sp.]